MSGTSRFAKTTQVEEAGTSIRSPQSPPFVSGLSQLAPAGKAGQESAGGQQLAPAALCAATREPWAELHRACSDLHLPRIITPAAAWIKIGVSLL